MQCNTKEDKAKMTKRVAEKALPFSVHQCSYQAEHRIWYDLSILAYK